MKIDQIDLYLIYLLKKDSRTSFTELAKKVKLSPPAVKYRIESLIKNEVILEFTIKTNLNKLTPTYQTYFFELQANTDQIDAIFTKLKHSNLVSNLFQIASSISIKGNTVPLSTQQIKYLTELFVELNLQSFSLIPILKEELGILSSRISAEKIENLYCAECQDMINMEDGFLELIDDNILGFCCDTCKNDFLINYNLVLKGN